jgi:hypothetical protein
VLKGSSSSIMTLRLRDEQCHNKTVAYVAASLLLFFFGVTHLAIVVWFIGSKPLGRVSHQCLYVCVSQTTGEQASFSTNTSACCLFTAYICTHISETKPVIIKKTETRSPELQFESSSHIYQPSQDHGTCHDRYPHSISTGSCYWNHLFIPASPFDMEQEKATAFS